MLTAYDFLWAKLFDDAGVDSLLVGDSLGMVVQGKASTVPVTLDEMIYHAEMVTRAATKALVVVDLPFMSYQIGPRQAIRSAGRILKETGASAVKLEGGRTQARTISALADAGIPVMAHIGMRPQSVNVYGSMGRVQRDGDELLSDAEAATEAGAFSVLIELVPAEIAARVTEAIDVPTIGIGAGPGCDGQVLVSPDLLGLTKGFEPKFLKRYADLHTEATRATTEYLREVRAGEFPSEDHSH